MVYFSYDLDRLNKQIHIVDFMGLLLLFRLPIIGTLLMELNDFRVIINTA